MCEKMSPGSTESSDGDRASLELIVCDASASAANGCDSASDEIAPLLTQSQKPKVNIFPVSYPQRKPRELVMETETSLTNFISWVWNGSRYSGLLCMALSSAIYFVMQMISDIFTVQFIPLLEAAFTRCMVILILSYLWLRRSGLPIFGPPHARKILIARALVGYLSLFSFAITIQILPLSQATVLSFTAPIMASIAARFILHEKLKITDIGGLALSFFGVLVIFRRMLTTQGGIVNAEEASTLNRMGSHHILLVLVGLFSSITGGISYCLIKAGSKASDHPMVTLFAFGILASPAAGISLFVFEEFVLPGFYSFALMLVLGVVAFLAEVFLARGLQLEKTSKVANVLYIQVALTQLWGMGFSRIAPSFGGIVGCVLILISIFYTMFIGPEKDMNEIA